MYDELVKFFDKYYSSNIMTLVILSKDNLETQEKYAKELFGSIKNKNI